MPDEFQVLREMRLSTRQGEDLFHVEGFLAREEISRPFLWTVDVVSDDREVDLENLLRDPVLLTLVMSDDEKLFLHGRVRRARQTGVEETHGSYQLEIVPTLWFASLTRNVRIFQDQTLKDILTAVLQGAGVADFRFELGEEGPTREFCVQYRESDLDFISRLAEESGVHYFFEHTSDKHTLVFSDRIRLSPGSPVGPFVVRPRDAHAARGLHELSLDHGVHPGSMELRDYDFLQAPTPLRASASGQGPEAVVDFHPGRFRSGSEGERWARIDLEREEGTAPRLMATGSALDLRAGFRFDVEGHPNRKINRGFVALRLEHQVSGFRHRSAGDDAVLCLTHLEALPVDAPWRPPLRTPRPRIAGYQTARVVGKPGEEIWVDKYGRVKVRFHWDHWADSDDENASCWVRVSTTWAGKQWGAIHLPRVGEEVIVGFLEGDPDQPIIVGRVYNDDRLPPYPLPDEKTKSGVRSRSSKNGDAQTFNEIRFEDLKGKEEIHVHAERNHRMVVENDRIERIGHDSDTEVKNDRKATIGKDETLTVGENRSATVGEKETITVGKDRSRTVGGSDALTVSDDRSAKVGKSATLTVGQDRKVTAGQKITLEAGTSLTLKVGSSKIEITSAGITLKATQITIQGKAAVEAKAPSVEVKGTTITKVEGAMTSVKGSALLQLQGGLTKIN